MPLDVLSVSLLVAVAATVAAWVRSPRPTSPALKLFGVLSSVALALEVVGVISRFYCWNNSILYNTFQLFEFLMILGILAHGRPTMRRTIRAAAVVGTAWFTWCIVFRGGPDVLASDAILLFSTLLSLLLMRILYLLARDSETPLYKLPFFWIFMGMLLYFGGLVPTLGGIRYVYEHDPALAAKLWAVVQGLAILRYSMAALGCWAYSEHD